MHKELCRGGNYAEVRVRVLRFLIFFSSDMVHEEAWRRLENPRGLQGRYDRNTLPQPSCATPNG
jgi:hypothetical protein